MISHCHRPLFSFALSAIAVAVFSTASAQAATLGHSRVVSMPKHPLRITVQLKDLTPEEQQSLKASIASVGAWAEAGIRPPVALDSLSTTLTQGQRPNSVQVVIQSTQVSSEPVVDVLLDVVTATSTQRHQVSVLQTQKPTPVSLAQQSSATPTPIAAALPAPVSSASGSQITVGKGQSLWQITRQLRSTQYNDQQLLAALVQANPNAFIHGNMNLLRAGAQLRIPDVYTIRAVNAQTASSTYHKHLEWFELYRQRLARGEAPPAALNLDGQATDAETASARAVDTVSAVAAQSDRLQLTAATEAQAQADQAAAVAQELSHTAQRLAQLTETPANTVADSAATSAQSASSDETDTSNASSSNATQAATAAGAAAAAQTTTDAASQTEKTTGWQSLSTWQWLGLLAALVLMIAWVLRRTYGSRLQYAEEIPPEVDVKRQQAVKNASIASDDIEFREIK